MANISKKRKGKASENNDAVNALQNKSLEAGPTVRKRRFQETDEKPQTYEGSEKLTSHQHSSVTDSMITEVSVQKFAQSRARELEALSKQVEFVGGTKLSFQRLPRHMRRRAMSHNIRRIPRRLRVKAQAELETREKKANKPPSRRHRRRPSNLLSEFQRRQRKNMWLETHIWHAKRFKMTTLWGYRLPVHPCDKSLRACYRASTYHCLLQDVSYECCIEMRGSWQAIVDAFSHVTSKDTAPSDEDWVTVGGTTTQIVAIELCLTVAAKTTSTGQRWGTVMMYDVGRFPQGAVAPITFMWQPQIPEDKSGTKEGEESEVELRVLWLWCHPANFGQVWSTLKQACAVDPSSNYSTINSVLSDSKSSSLHNDTEVLINQLQLRSLKDELVKLRLTGPASNLLLSETLKLADINTLGCDPKDNGAQGEESKHWWQNYYCKESRKSQFEVQASCWELLTKCQSPDELPPHGVLALTVRDPRILLPSARSKSALDEADSRATVVTWDHLPVETAVSPLWNKDVRSGVTGTKMTEQEMNRRRAQLLVPGSLLQLGAEESRVPVILLQQPGSQPSSSKGTACVRSGVGSGWDLIAPKGFGMAFWVALVYRGARVGGLREARSLATRSGQLQFPHDFPDSSAGRQHQQDTKDQCLDVYVRRPPAKRVSFHRLGVPSPFCCPWSQLVAEWYGRAPPLLNPPKPGCTPTVIHTAADKEVFSSDEVPENKEKSDHIDCRGDEEKAPVSYPGVYVLRNRRLLRTLRNFCSGSKQAPKYAGSKLSKLFSQMHHKTMISEHLQSIVPVAVSSVSRGVPAERAMICLPSAADLESLRKGSDSGCPVERLHSRRKNCEGSTKEKSNENKKQEESGKKVSPSAVTTASDRKTEKGGNKCSKKPLNRTQLRDKEELSKEPSRIVDVTDRPIIGFLTSGDFDLGQGRGFGLGFCSLVGLLAAFETGQADMPLLVLMRNPTSRQYRFAHLSILA